MIAASDFCRLLEGVVVDCFSDDRALVCSFILGSNVDSSFSAAAVISDFWLTTVMLCCDAFVCEWLILVDVLDSMVPFCDAFAIGVIDSEVLFCGAYVVCMLDPVVPPFIELVDDDFVSVVPFCATFDVVQLEAMV